MKIRHCQSCGAANEAEANFCRDCGGGLSPDSDDQSQTLAAGQPERAPVRTEVIAIPHQHDDTAMTPLTAENQRARTGRLFAGNSSPEMAVSQAESEPEAEESARMRMARELARTSGLRNQARLSYPFRALIVGVALLLTFGAWLLYREQGQASSSGHSGLTLVGADESSNRFTLSGEQLRDEGNFEEAIAQFKEALKLTPNNMRAQSMLARTYNAVGRVEEALEVYSHMLEVDPKNLEARLQRADIYRVRGAWNDAAREYRKIIELDPSSEQALAALDAMEQSTAERSAAYTANRHRFERKDGGKVLPPAADHSRVSLPMSELALGPLPSSPASGNDGEATPEEDKYRRSLAEALKTRGIRLNSAGRYAEAIREYKKAQNFTPEDKDLNYLIATSFSLSGQFAMAVEYYRKCDSGTYAPVAQNAVKTADERARKAARKKDKQ
ncbi:MAG TPA: tetratricopeptide repeat protein [Blastocatellia bacterium]|nr:tetratricopeptide repeat protein [Blastocatellia bacterium]